MAPNGKTTLHRQILRLAIPSIVSNITVPLLGIIDLAIVGHIGDSAMIGAIAVGGMMFNLIYWVFGFLRMGTSGLTAQAFGAGNISEQQRLLYRSMMIGLTVAVMLIICQKPLFGLAMTAVGASDDVVGMVDTYYNICIWGAPAVLISNGLMGWFIGMQDTRTPMWVAIFQNLSNIAISLVMVFAFHLQLRGVAFGTLIAQYVGLIIAISLIPRSFLKIDFAAVVRREGWGQMFRVNRDIFFRTLCLVGVNMYFLSMGARSGNDILAVNTLLMEFYILFSFILDGFAFAGEALGGRYWGGGDMMMFRRTVGSLFIWGTLLTVIFTIVYIFFGSFIVSMLTSDGSVVSLSADYIGFTWLIPVCGMAAFVWDGIFIGITATRGMLLSAVVSTIVFISVDMFFHTDYGNNSLWAAFLMFLLMRGLAQSAIYFVNIKKRQN